MIQPIVILFIGVASVFAVVHALAVQATLYWYYWWFDIVMHFWGGLLIALGVFALTSFRWVSVRPTLWLVLLITTIIVLTWEVFEWSIGLMDPALHLSDAISDVVLGLAGSVLGYTFLKRIRK